MTGKTHHAIFERPGVEAVAEVSGREIARTGNPVILHEFAGSRTLPPVCYFPREDVAMTLLTRTAKSTRCPIKGDASYFDVNFGDSAIADAGWSYEDPLAEAAPIRGHVAFYPDRVRVTLKE